MALVQRITVNVEQLMRHEYGFSAEASELELPPGCWPLEVVVRGKKRSGADFEARFENREPIGMTGGAGYRYHRRFAERGEARSLIIFNT